MTTPNPTPNDMPGAPAPKTEPQPNSQLQEPISTSTPPAPAPQQQPQQQQPPAQPPAKGDEPATPGPDTVEYWKARAREWEDRGKVKPDVLEKAKKWEEEQAAKRTREENQAIELQTERALREAAEMSERRARIAFETGVPPENLSGGTEEEMRAAAAKALEWRGPQSQEPPRPQTAAVPASTVTSTDPIGHSPNGIQQLTREQFIALSPHDRMEAVRAGACVNLGVGKPAPQRRMGNEVEVAAYGNRK